jgi:flagellar biosynthesis/type III secretory pathway protein FliH
MMAMEPQSRFIVRGDILRAHRDAQAIVTDAREEAVRLRAELLAERIDTLEKARQQGLKQGLAEAAAVVSNAIRAVDAFWKDRESELAEVAFAIAYRIVESLPADTILAQLVSKAIADHGADVHLTLRTTPDAAAHLREFLKNSEHVDRITVLADPVAAPGECTLSHRRGQANLGLLAQFRAMMSSLPAAVPTTHDADPRPKQ